MMMAHSYILIITFTNTIKQPEEREQPPYELIIAEEDIEQGKKVVWNYNHNKTCYKNEKKQLENYNVGLGTANNRTTNQKMLPKKCTQHIMNHAANDIILVDASIYGPKDTKTLIKTIMKKTGY